MKFETVKNLVGEQFRCLTGVKRTTFDRMVGILEQLNKNKKIKGGTKNKLRAKRILLQKKIKKRIKNCLGIEF